MASHPDDETALGGAAPRGREFHTGSNREASAKAIQSKCGVAHVRATETCEGSVEGVIQGRGQIPSEGTGFLCSYSCVPQVNPARRSPRRGAQPGVSPRTSQGRSFPLR